MGQETAQMVAIRALGWIAAQDEVFQAFMGTTGASLPEIRARAEDPAFQTAVLDFLLLQDDWVLGFAEATGLRPEDPLRARAVLGGGDMTHWT